MTVIPDGTLPAKQYGGNSNQAPKQSHRRNEMELDNGSRILTVSVRWMARVTGLLLIGMVMLFAIGEGIPSLTGHPPAVQVELIAMGLMLVGFALGWHWEAAGGGLALGGFLTFCGAELVTNGKLPGGAIPLLVIPGVLFLISYWLKSQAKDAQEN